MSDDKKPGEKKPAEAGPTLVKMKALLEWNGELSIGEDRYPVKDGVVEVPPWHVGHANQSGFQPF